MTKNIFIYIIYANIFGKTAFLGDVKVLLQNLYSSQIVLKIEILL